MIVFIVLRVTTLIPPVQTRAKNVLVTKILPLAPAHVANAQQVLTAALGQTWLASLEITATEKRKT